MIPRFLRRRRSPQSRPDAREIRGTLLVVRSKLREALELVRAQEHER